MEPTPPPTCIGNCAQDLEKYASEGKVAVLCSNDFMQWGLSEGQCEECVRRRMHDPELIQLVLREDEVIRQKRELTRRHDEILTAIQTRRDYHCKNTRLEELIGVPNLRVEWVNSNALFRIVQTYDHEANTPCERVEELATLRFTRA